MVSSGPDYIGPLPIEQWPLPLDEQQPKDITYVHEADGNPDDNISRQTAALDSTAGSMPSEHYARRMLTGCLSELQGVLAARCPAILEAGSTSTSSLPYGQDGSGRSPSQSTAG